MIGEAIVLAGGLGTRLRSAVPDLPKCMAPVAGEPFIAHVIRYFQKQGIDRFIFSLGFRHEMVEEYLSKYHTSLNYSCSIEDEPLGTGGGILKSLSLSTGNDVLILNGDTFFAVNVPALSDFHAFQQADCSICLKNMRNSNRYGVVETNSEGKILSFLEKKWYENANINGGVYALNVESFSSLPFPQKFSFEKDYLERYYNRQKMVGLIQTGYFIDIGIPEDYERAQKELTNE